MWLKKANLGERRVLLEEEHVAEDDEEDGGGEYGQVEPVHGPDEALAGVGLEVVVQVEGDYDGFQAEQQQREEVFLVEGQQEGEHRVVEEQDVLLGVVDQRAQGLLGFGWLRRVLQRLLDLLQVQHGLAVLVRVEAVDEEDVVAGEHRAGHQDDDVDRWSAEPTVVHDGHRVDAEDGHQLDVLQDAVLGDVADHHSALRAAT
jgi:hypothetical protein